MKRAMSDKKQLKEGRIRRFVDWIFYSLLNGINDSIINALRDDPEIDKAIEDFEESQEELKSALRDIGENPQKYIDAMDEK